MKQYEFKSLILAPILESHLIVQSGGEKVMSSYKIDKPCQNCGKSYGTNIPNIDFLESKRFVLEGSSIAHTSK